MAFAAHLRSEAGPGDIASAREGIRSALARYTVSVQADNQQTCIDIPTSKVNSMAKIEGQLEMITAGGTPCAIR